MAEAYSSDSEIQARIRVSRFHWHIAECVQKAKEQNRMITEELIQLVKSSIANLNLELAGKRNEKYLEKVINCIFLKCEVVNTEELCELQKLVELASSDRKLKKTLTKSVKELVNYRNENPKPVDAILQAAKRDAYREDSGIKCDTESSREVIPVRSKWFHKGDKGRMAAQRISRSISILIEEVEEEREGHREGQEEGEEDDAYYSVDELEETEKRNKSKTSIDIEDYETKTFTLEDDGTTRHKHAGSFNSIPRQEIVYGESLNEGKTQELCEIVKTHSESSHYNLCFGQISCGEESDFLEKSESERLDWAEALVGCLKRAEDIVVFLSVTIGSIYVRFALMPFDNDAEAANGVILQKIVRMYPNGIPDYTTSNGAHYRIKHFTVSTDRFAFKYKVVLTIDGTLDITPEFKEHVKEMILASSIFAEQDRVVELTNFHTTREFDGDTNLPDGALAVRRAENPEVMVENPLGAAEHP